MGTHFPITTKTMSTISLVSSLSSNPLFSSIVTLYLLFLLYFPYIFVSNSPILISTFVLLLNLMRLGASQHLKTKGLEPGPTNFGSGSLTDVDFKDLGAGAELCFEQVESEPSTEFGPSPRIVQTELCLGLESRPTKVGLDSLSDVDSKDLEVGADLCFIQVESQPLIKLESGPKSRLESEPNRFDEGKPEIGPTQWEDKEAVAEPHYNRVESSPSPEPKPENVEHIETRPSMEPGPEIGFEPNIKTELEKNYNGPHFEWLDQPKPDPNHFCLNHISEWDVGAPLEVIYEAYEGEEDEEEHQDDAFDQSKDTTKVDNYPSLARYYPESDSDSGWDSDLGSSISSWDEGEKEGLIEIPLHFHDTKKKEMKKVMEVVQVDDDDEDNLIEIDISHTRRNHGSFL